MSSVRKRTLPGGGISWQVDYRDQGGKRRSRQFRTKKEAESHETTVRSEIAAGVHTADSDSVTVKRAGELWIETCETEGLQPSTLKQYREHLNLHITPELGTVKLSRLTRPSVETFKDKLLQSRSRPMARKVISSLKAILSEAMRRGLVAQNVALGASIDFRRSEDDETEDSGEGLPSKDEIRAMLAKAAEIWPLTRQILQKDDKRRTEPVPWRPLIMLAVFSGMRASELAGLAWPHVDFRAGTVKVRQRVDFQKRLGPPKSKAGRRTIPLPPAVVGILREWKVACPPGDQDLVFPARGGGPMHYNVIRKQCLHILLEACEMMQDGKPPFGLHALRHFAASLFIELGWTPKKIQVVMGHSTIQQTFDVYGHLLDGREDHSEAMARLESSLFGR
ncbi:MAG: tyrosine-type recombinase/integrase [Azospirillum sp.]|nr:tyrosine-type recombinase/integrase [Azospirillum sp.]